MRLIEVLPAAKIDPRTRPRACARSGMIPNRLSILHGPPRMRRPGRFDGAQHGHVKPAPAHAVLGVQLAVPASFTAVSRSAPLLEQRIPE